MGARLLVLCLLVLVNCLLVYKAVWGANGLLDHAELRARQTAAEEECLRLDQTNRTLSREIRLLQTDSAYMEKMVRERLHYLHDNEILYLFDKGPAGPGPAARDAGAKSRRGSHSRGGKAE